MISPLLQQLIRQAEQEKIARDFWVEVNELAEKYEVPADYILQEFYTFPEKNDFYCWICSWYAYNYWSFSNSCRRP